jgi:hypothetical protein
MPKNDLQKPPRRGGRRPGAGRKKKRSPLKRLLRNNRDRNAWRRDRLKVAELDKKIKNFVTDVLSDEYKSLIARRKALALKVHRQNRMSASAGESPSFNSDSDEVPNSQLQTIFENILTEK